MNREDSNTGLTLSVMQPFAWCIVRPDLTDPRLRDVARRYGLMKDCENRTWETPVRGWVTVHAGKKIDYDGYDWIARMFPAVDLPRISQFELGGDVGRMQIVDCLRHSRSRWFVGPYAFKIADSQPLPFTPRRGQLGFFR